jgi:hypothetical protein
MKKTYLAVALAAICSLPVTAATHKPLVERLTQVLDGETAPVLDNDYLLMLNEDSYLWPGGPLVGRDRPGTANYQAMAWSTEYVRVWRGGELPAWIPPDRRNAYQMFWRRKVISYLAWERTNGIMRGEMLCADPHHNFHLASVMLIRIGAIEFNHKDVLDATSQYFRDLFAVYSAVATPNGQICSAGARVQGLPCTEVGTMVYRLVKRLPQLGPAAKPDIWADNFYAAARGAQMLLRAGDDLGGAAKMKPADLAKVRLAYPLRVRRYKDRVETEILANPETFTFYLHEQFATFTSLKFTTEWNVGRIFSSGGLSFIRGFQLRSPEESVDRPLLVVTSK